MFWTFYLPSLHQTYFLGSRYFALFTACDWQNNGPQKATSESNGTCDCCYLTCKRDFADAIKNLGCREHPGASKWGWWNQTRPSKWKREEWKSTSEKDLKMLCCWLWKMEEGMSSQGRKIASERMNSSLKFPKGS